MLARRRANRRTMLVAMGASYLVDAALLALYAHAGATHVHNARRSMGLPA